MIPDTHIEPGLRLFTSNRLEILANKLAAALGTPLPSPLQSEVVVVRNKGMERWLKLELARRHGVCANQRFPFPEAFGRELFRTLSSRLADPHFVDRETILWRVMKVLPELLSRPAFDSLARYLGDGPAAESEPDERKRVQLAARIANLFDQYLVFRPAMMLEWDEHGGEGWQPELWRTISADWKDSHPAALWRRFHQALAEPAFRPGCLPERISIFGVSALPPFYLGLFAALAGRIQVNLFLLQPSQEYWGDITSPREGERILRQQRREGGGPFEAHLDRGNRLLASLGYLGRDFLKLVLDAGDWISDDTFFEPGEDSLLHCVQSDILHLRDRGKDAGSSRRAMAGSDDSIRVHSCHSPLREMEVLHDHLLDWFQRDPSLTPRDIVVMTPEIEAYAPFVQAVFGSPEDPAREIPFSLADRGARRQSHLVDTFLQILDLPDSRLGAATVLALLEAESVRANFGLSEADLEIVRSWVERTNIRWGRDEAQRARLDLPRLPGNTWRAGLDRLLLGYSMAGGGEKLFDGLLPFDDVEGDAARILGPFIEFAERLFGTMDTLGGKHSLDDWSEVLNDILDRFFQPVESAQLEWQTIRDALRVLRRQRELSGFDEPVALSVVLERLRPALEEDRFSSGFLTGGVTFCGLKPMRSIPFKRVCLVGMNDGAFPRSTHHLSFDLMAAAPRLGDRSTREDDRYLFLETILSAREKLYLSYVGQSVRDNKVAPPSVLVSELLDYVEQGFQLELAAGPSPVLFRSGQSREARISARKKAAAQNVGAEKQLLLLPETPGRREETRVTRPQGLRDHLVLQHRLQAFSADHFGADDRLFSYSTENCLASESTRRPRLAPALFIPTMLGEPDAGFRQVTLQDLTDFLGNPARIFLNRRLRIFLPKGEPQLNEREPFVLEGLAGFRLKQELLASLHSGAAPAAVEARQKAAGALPLGTVGEVDYHQISTRVQTFYQELAAAGLLDWLDPLDVDLTVGEFRLTGRIAPRTRSGPLLYRCARLKARDLLCAWVMHLAANAATAGAETTLVAEHEVHRFATPTDARGLLLQLLGLYWRGLGQPLKFFPETALAFAQVQLESCDGKKLHPGARTPMERAHQVWKGSEYRRIEGESTEAHIELCFRGMDPLDQGFEEIAGQILEPLLRSQTREER